MSDAKMIRPLSEFYSEDHTRLARIMTHGWNDYMVEMWENNQLKESRVITGHNLQYVEDCAENFIRKYGEFKQ